MSPSYLELVGKVPPEVPFKALIGMNLDDQKWDLDEPGPELENINKVFTSGFLIQM